MTLRVALHDRPEVSVVIVTHGSWHLTERAIQAVAEHTERPFEVTVVDNASRDETRQRLAELGAVRTILNDLNLGFGPATNQGAARARGEFLVLLNSDAVVHPGWLEPLLEALAQPDVGAVIPRYLNEDGTLQEAGALLALDGTTHLYGEGDDPARPCYRFRRAVDYGSAVCMVVRRETFDTLGGFDEGYAPAYYEDVDLCLRLAERGKSVIYQPRSTVTHVRHGSGGAANAVELSERNRRRFIERWGPKLAGRPASFLRSSDQGVILARDAMASPRLLLCTSPAHGGAEPIAEALLARWPRGRLTWMVRPPGFDPEPWLACGVEVFADDDHSWLCRRLFHYDVVLRGTGVESQALAEIERTQPQAPQVALDELSGPAGDLLAGLVAVLARAGVA